MPVDKWRTMLSRPQNQHDWLIYILFVVLAVAGLALLVLDLGYGYAYVGIVWPILLALAVFSLTRRRAT